MTDNNGKDTPKAAGPDDEKTQFAAGPKPQLEDEKTVFKAHYVHEPTIGASEAARSIAPLTAPRTVSTLLSLAAAIEIGTEINNNYIIEGVLKSGGMGSVYRGTEIGTGDPVAIKAILPELAEDPKAGTLFKREARTLRQLSHAAIVRYYNYVHDRELDQFFLIMEYIEGTPLSDYIRTRGKLPVLAIETLIARLSEGLAQAHATGVIHRDLSPDNVMLPDGNVAEARLIDFGISKSTLPADGAKDNEFAGKYKYVSPEQLSGADIGPRADIYGLALMMAAAAIGVSLPMGSSPRDAADARLVIPDLKDVPERLRPLLRHMLEPDPAMRPGSMYEVGRMVETPALIPDRYFEGGRPLSMGGKTVPPVGLQVPQQGTGPLTRQPLPRAPAPPDVAAPDASSRALWLLLGAFVVVSGVVGFGAWQMGMIAERPVIEGASPAPVSVQNTSRAGFLAGLATGPCTYLTRIGAGPNAGMIEAYSQTGQDFPDVPVAYEAQFGARPAVMARQITADQCPALRFVKGVQGRGGDAPRLEMSTDVLVSGQAMTVRISDIGQQAIWAALITPAGTIFNLTERLSDVVGGQRVLNFGLTLPEGTEAAPQLIMIVASDAPLARAATAPDGDSAADVLPLILDEIERLPNRASASLGFVMLRPQGSD